VSAAPAWIDAPWWEVYGAELRAHELTQRQWINALAKAWGLVRREDSLANVGEVLEQRDYVARLLGRKYFHTYAMPPWQPFGRHS
jgi:hypothetical protein